MNLHKAHIKTDEDFQTVVTVDGKELHYLTGLNLQIDPQSVPQLTMKMMVLPDAYLQSSLYIEYTPKSLQEASNMIIQTINNNDAVHESIISSIVNALRDYNIPFMPEKDLAEHILEKIIGEK